MNEPKGHHVVAKMHQKRFLNDEGGLFFFDFDHPELGVRLTQPSALFKRTNYYSSIDIAGNKDVGFEKYLANEVEGPADLVFEKIVKTVRNGSFPNLRDFEIEVLHRFLYFQIKRVPETLEGVANSTDIELDLQRRMEEDLLHGNLSTEQWQDLQSPSVLNRMAKAVRVGAQRLNDGRVLNAFSKFGLRFARVKDSKKSLILGSNPVLVGMKQKQKMAVNRARPIWLPISYDIAVAPWGEVGQEYLLDFGDQREIRLVNTSIASQSRFIAGKSKLLVQSLSKLR